jgi:hypothetical protein
MDLSGPIHKFSWTLKVSFGRFSDVESEKFPIPKTVGLGAFRAKRNFGVS